MSIIFLLATFFMAKNGVTDVQMDFFIAWALFSMADAMWFKNFFK
jgi:hypothetical protein